MREPRTMIRATLLSPRDVPKVLDISYLTLKQRIYKEKLRAVRAAGGLGVTAER
jgi:hypothetical protein